MQKIYIIMALFALASATHAQGDLYISSGATLYTNGSSIVTLQNTKLTNDGGSFTANDGTVVFKGSGTNAQSSINGTGTTALKNVTIDKTANGVQLNQNISVSGNLTLTSGGLDLAGNVDFGTTGSLQAETEANRVSGTGGYLRRIATLTAPSSVNAGNLGAMLTSTQDFGSTEIRRKHDIVTATGSGIVRSYEIHPTNNTGLNATLRFHYFDAELNGNDENTMVLWRSVSGAGNWIAQTTANRDATANWVEVSGINAFSSWTSANPGALPIKLLSFTGEKGKGTHRLDWTTATEQNSSHFNIEYSVNGYDFTDIGRVEATGNSNSVKSYTFDYTKYNSGANYYRLKMTDKDGTYEYSNIINIKEDGKKNTVYAYPNPSETGIFILQGKVFNNTNAAVTNVLGQQINATIINNQLDLSAMPSGVYFVRIDGENNTIRVVKE